MDQELPARQADHQPSGGPEAPLGQGARSHQGPEQQGEPDGMNGHGEDYQNTSDEEF
jgi:hypothetical protein